MAAREAIMTTIRTARERAGINARPERPFARGNPVPVSDPERRGMVDEFIALARADSASVDELETVDQVPAAVARYVAAEGLDKRVVLAPDPAIRDLDWVSANGIEASVRQLHPDGDTAVTGCYAAVAEAGALVVATSPQHPLELNFLPASHVVLLGRSQLVATFECLWQQLRRDYADIMLPRCINLIVGPSRTADLGLPVKLGAHGPGRVHILLVNGR